MIMHHSLFQHWQTNLVNLISNQSFTYLVNCRFTKWNAASMSISLSATDIIIVCVHLMLLLYWVRANIGQPQIMCTRSRVVTLNQIIQIYSNKQKNYFTDCMRFVAIRSLNILTNSLCSGIHLVNHHSFLLTPPSQSVG